MAFIPNIPTGSGTSQPDENRKGFGVVSVSGQSDVVADRDGDQITLVAGSNMTLTTSASGDSVTFESTGGSSNSFNTIAVSGQSDVVADTSSDTLTLVAGSNVTITTDAGADSITIAASGSGGGATYVVATSDESLSNDINLQDDDELFFAVTTNSVYVAEWYLNFTTGTSTAVDAGLSFTVPASATITWSMSGYQTTATSLDAQQRHSTRYQSTSQVNHGVISTATIDASPAWITAIIRTAGTSGNVKLQWAQAATSGTALVRKADSFVRYVKYS